MKTLFLTSALALTILGACTTQSQKNSNPAVLNIPANVMIAPGLEANNEQTLLETAQTYYSFWNTGDEALARKALSGSFIDLSLPEGRPQGIEGPIIASTGFRKAVPDLTMDVEQVYVLQDTVIGRLRFKGHFTGTYGDVKGQGQTIDFNAVDMYTIKDGQITQNWHLEDNLTLMTQLGIVGG